jgi:hypothetical protein
MYQFFTENGEKKENNNKIITRKFESRTVAFFKKIDGEK